MFVLHILLRNSDADSLPRFCQIHDYYFLLKKARGRFDAIIKRWLIIAWENEVLVHFGLAKLLLNLCLKNVELALHVPVDVCKALLCCMIVCVLSLLVGERRMHALIVLLELDHRVLP